VSLHAARSLDPAQTRRVQPRPGRFRFQTVIGAPGVGGLDRPAFEALLDDIPTVRTPAGGRRCRPDKCHADKAYDHRRCRGYLTRRGIKVRIARRGIEPSDRLGRHRWKAERSIAWLAGCRRLGIRYDRDSERFFAFAMLARARLGYNRLPCTAEAHARSP
jgi:transposase